MEAKARARGHRLIAGVDEAGRGCLAGPVAAAAVILPEQFAVEGIHDSKALTAVRREQLAERVQAEAAAWAVGWASVAEIEERNILRATHLAMARALAALDPAPDFALVDGLPVEGLPCPHQATPRADASCLCVAAASILAKVTRDRLMADLDEKHPGYGFSTHKGYGTPAHLEALRRLGPCEAHRRTFRPVSLLLHPPPPSESLETRGRSRVEPYQSD